MPNTEIPKAEIEREVQNRVIRVIRKNLPIYHSFGYLSDTENTNLEYWPRYLIALTLSVVWNFTLNRKFTFQSSNNVPKAMFKVFIYYLIFTPLSTMLGNYLTSIGWNDYLVTGINMALNLITEFLYQRYYVFKDSIDTKVVKI